MKRSQAPSQTVAKRAKAPPKKNANNARLDRGNLLLNPRSVGFPRTLTMRHRYYDVNLLTSTGGAIAHYQFSANGLYDPNITGTGHQPMYFDTLTGIYDHYTVVGSKIHVVAIGQTASVAGTLTLWINDDTTTSATLFSLPEQTSASTSLVMPISSGVKTNLKNAWSAKKTFGGSVLGNDDLQGTGSANPAEQSYFQLSYASADGTSTSTCLFQVFIEYIAVWDELKDIAAN